MGENTVLYSQHGQSNKLHILNSSSLTVPQRVWYVQSHAEEELVSVASTVVGNYFVKCAVVNVLLWREGRLQGKRFVAKSLFVWENDAYAGSSWGMQSSEFWAGPSDIVIVQLINFLTQLEVLESNHSLLQCWTQLEDFSSDCMCVVKLDIKQYLIHCDHTHSLQSTA